MQITAETLRRRESLTFLFAIIAEHQNFWKNQAPSECPKFQNKKKGIAGCFPAIPMLSTASSDIL
jgi:hypothetical protein